jgi:hypothetical protein
MQGQHKALDEVMVEHTRDGGWMGTADAGLKRKEEVVCRWMTHRQGRLWMLSRHAEFRKWQVRLGFGWKSIMG